MAPELTHLCPLTFGTTLLEVDFAATSTLVASTRPAYNIPRYLGTLLLT